MHISIFIYAFVRDYNNNKFIICYVIIGIWANKSNICNNDN